MRLGVVLCALASAVRGFPVREVDLMELLDNPITQSIEIEYPGAKDYYDRHKDKVEQSLGLESHGYKS